MILESRGLAICDTIDWVCKKENDGKYVDQAVKIS